MVQGVYLGNRDLQEEKEKKESSGHLGKREIEATMVVQEVKG